MRRLHRTHWHSFARRLLPLLLIFALLVSAAAPAAWASQVERTALVRIELDSPAEVPGLLRAGVEVLHHRPTEQGGGYVLARLPQPALAELSRQGVDLQVLERGSRSASYYFALARPGVAVEAAARAGKVLFYEGSEALVRASAAQAEELARLGFEIALVGPEALPLPQPQPAAPAALSAVTPDPYIAQLLEQVAEGGPAGFVMRLSGVRAAPLTPPYVILTRHTNSGVPIQKAAEYVYETFQAAGLTTSYKPWSRSGYSGQNVEGVLPGYGTQPGYGAPPCLYLITAHLDDMPSGATAPGADDNASGVAAVMLAAQLLSQHRWECTLRFVAFTGEEQGLLGSYVYAQQAFAAGDAISGVLNLDMIAYDSNQFPIVDLHARTTVPGSEAIANLFVDVVAAYNLTLVPHKFLNASLGNYSDNKSFWDFGYPAILGIEDYDDFTPYYHTVNDTLSSLNTAYFNSFVRASLGTLAHLGRLIPPVGTLSGQVRSAAGGQPLAGARVQAWAGEELAAEASSGPDGLYDLALAPGLYTLSASQPGFQPCEAAPVQVAAYDSLSLDFELEPAPPEPLGPITLSYLPAAPLAGEVVTFTAAISSGALPIHYAWDFGDGSALVQGEGLEAVAHAFPAAYTLETYTVTATAENAVSSASAQAAVAVLPLPEPLEPLGPITLSYAPLAPLAGEVVTFTAALSSGSPPVTYAWDFGDSSDPLSGEGLAVVTHTFSLPGAYTVTLSAENAVSTRTAQALVTVQPVEAPLEPLGPLALSYTPLEPLAGEVVTFSAVITSGTLPVMYAWDFGDGSEPLSGEGLAQTAHAFTLPGTYTVTVAAVNPVSRREAQVQAAVRAVGRSLYLPLLQGGAAARSFERMGLP